MIDIIYKKKKLITERTRKNFYNLHAYDFRDTKCVHLEWFYGPFSLIRNIKIKDVIAMQVHILADYESPLQ